MGLFLAALLGMMHTGHGVRPLNLRDSALHPQSFATLPTINFKICLATLKETGYWLATTSPLISCSLLSSSWQLLLYLLSLRLPILGISHTHTHMKTVVLEYVTLCDWSLLLNVFKVHLHCSM